MTLSKRVPVPLALIVATLCGVRPTAQSGSGAITGIVKDSTGGTLPGAIVKVLNQETGVAVEGITNQEGVYRIAALVPGRYRIEVDLDGFEPVVRESMTLSVDETVAIDVALGVGRQSEQIEVVATAALALAPGVIVNYGLRCEAARRGFRNLN